MSTIKVTVANRTTEPILGMDIPVGQPFVGVVQEHYGEELLIKINVAGGMIVSLSKPDTRCWSHCDNVPVKKYQPVDLDIKATPCE